ncbi:MAG: hypothetical protein M1817_000908 [Caeruleum heppii]|nr:MAG: hypothetical protein M1817_000908 [Caeruleum heppii]
MASQDPRWSGVLRFAPLLMVPMLVLSIVTLACSIAYVRTFDGRPLDENRVRYRGVKPPTTAMLAFYGCTAPFLTLLYAPSILFLHLRSLLSPLVALLTSLLVWLGWTTQLAFWTNCEEVSEDMSGQQPSCPQYALSLRRDFESLPARKVRFALGWVIWAGLLIFVAASAAALFKGKRSSKHERKMSKMEDYPTHSEVEPLP